jgi:hypothetical protein
MPAHNFQDLTGQTFTRLFVLWQTVKNRHGHPQWVCVCCCGRSVITSTNCLRTKHTQSCGCLKKERISQAQKTHGKSKSPEYTVWNHMRQRCLDPSNPSFKNYGGRGITICAEWQNSFETFLGDMGERPTKAHTLERLDNNGGYSPDNCAWRTMKEQLRNTRRNHMLALYGKTQCTAVWAKDVGIHVGTIHSRLN